MYFAPGHLQEHYSLTEALPLEVTKRTFPSSPWQVSWPLCLEPWTPKGLYYLPPHILHLLLGEWTLLLDSFASFLAGDSFLQSLGVL